MNNFYTWVNKELRKRGWNYSELARRSELSRGSITNTMNQRNTVTWDFCNSISKALQIPPEEIFQKAGLLKTPPNQANTSELINTANNLRADDLKLLTDFAKLLYQRDKQP